MKPLLLILFHSVLAAGGYFAGAHIIGNATPAADPDPAHEEAAHELSEDAATDDGILRDPRTGATFAESREQLDNRKPGSDGRRNTRRLVEGKRNEGSLLAIDRTFALASREDLISFFADEKLAKLDSQVLSAAYGRLAALAPEDAAAIWMDRHQREKKRTGIASLVHAWALRDPASAEDWVNTLPESADTPIPDRSHPSGSTSIRKKALIALLDAAAESDSGLAIRRFTELEDVTATSNLAGRLALSLDPAEFPAFAERIQSMTGEEWAYGGQLYAVVEIWAERDAEAALAWVKEQPPSQMRDYSAYRLGQIIIKSDDPATTAREAAVHAADLESFAEIAGQAWMDWLSSDEDDESAMEWLQEHGEHLEISRHGSWGSRAWPAERADQVLPRLSAIPNVATRNRIAQSILEQLADLDPGAALARAEEYLPPGDSTRWFVFDTVRNLASREKPGPALEWIMENLSDGEIRNRSVSRLMFNWSDSDPRAAADMAATLPEDLRDRAYSSISHHWATSSPEQIFDYLKATDDPSSVRSLARFALREVGFNQDARLYLDQALALPDAKMRAEAVPAFIDGWARANLVDSAAALNKLEKGPVRDASIEKFVSAAAQSDRESAVTWSLAIGDTDKRRQVTMRQARQWLNADRENATRWIETADKLPAEWKAQLLEPKQ